MEQVAQSAVQLPAVEVFRTDWMEPWATSPELMAHSTPGVPFNLSSWLEIQEEILRAWF